MKRDNPDDQDSAWQLIVDNYGDRVLEPEEVVDAPPVAEAPEPAEVRDDPDELSDEVDDQFVPANPPPIPMPSPDRFLAWVGVFGSPTVLLICLVLSIGIPTLLGWVLIGGFIGGFCYLIFSDPREPREPWDDGAVV